MNRCIINEYLVTNSKICNNKQIAFVSDIHSNVDKFAMLIERLYKLKIHTLLIGGDLIDSTEDDKRNLIIKELLYDLAKTMKIFIAIGNHDMLHFGKDASNHRSAIKSSNTDFIDSLSSNNIYVSGIPYNNATFSKWSLDDEIDISSLNLPFDYYWNKESIKDFITLLDEIEKPDINNQKFNILLCHSPKNIPAVWNTIYYLRQFDLILTGHMHSGLIPYFLRKQTYGRGLIGPYMEALPEYAYGCVSDNHNLFISGGVTKISSSSGLDSHKIFDIIYPSEIELFNLQHDTNNSLKKTKSRMH